MTDGVPVVELRKKADGELLVVVDPELKQALMNVLHELAWWLSRRDPLRR